MATAGAIKVRAESILKFLHNYTYVASQILVWEFFQILDRHLPELAVKLELTQVVRVPRTVLNILGYKDICGYLY